MKITQLGATTKKTFNVPLYIYTLFVVMTIGLIGKELKGYTILRRKQQTLTTIIFIFN